MNKRTAQNPADLENDDGSASLGEAEIDSSAEELPQSSTESYGTGVKEAPGYIVGGNIDADSDQADAVGEESVGGTVVTPDMDLVDNLGKAVGLEMDDANFLHTSEILEHRDDQRWELEPKSSEDYQERRGE